MIELECSMKIRRIIKEEIEVPNLGDRIKEAREKSGQSVTSLAKKAEISRNYWYQLESESTLSGLSEETLKKIEKALNTTFNVTFPSPSQAFLHKEETGQYKV